MAGGHYKAFVLRAPKWLATALHVGHTSTTRALNTLWCHVCQGPEATAPRFNVSPAGLRPSDAVNQTQTGKRPPTAARKTAFFTFPQELYLFMYLFIYLFIFNYTCLQIFDCKLGD